MEWTPQNIICLVLIAGCFILKGMGYDTVIDSILLAAASFYFGLNLPKPEEKPTQ